jgi:hypothetical protein
MKKYNEAGQKLRFVYFRKATRLYQFIVGWFIVGISKGWRSEGGNGKYQFHIKLRSNTDL